MSKPFNPTLCECEGNGWVRRWNREEGNVDWDLCLAGCLPPPKPPTDFSKPQQDNKPGVLAQIKEWQSLPGKAVA